MDRDAALATSGVELDRAYPSLEAPQKRVSEAFEALSALARRSIGTPLARDVLRSQRARRSAPALPVRTILRDNVVEHTTGQQGDNAA